MGTTSSRTVLAVTALLIWSSGAVSAPAAAAEPALDWQPCAEEAMAGLECAFLTVPRDWTKPDGATMKIAMARHRSDGSDAERIGSMFFNPGGPGGSGLDALSTAWGFLPSEAQRHFDLVTWDPRGVGQSEGLDDCEPALVPAPPATGPVDWADLQERTRAEIARVNRACQRRHPVTVAHMGTNDNVEDLDAMRQAVGDPGLTFWAWSYGTRIGYVYALKHPDSVRAIVLDGSTSPNGSVLGFAGPYSTAADAGLNILFQLHPQAATDYRTAVRALEIAPVSLPGGGIYTRWDLDLFLQEYASWESLYGVLADYLHQVMLAATSSGPTQTAAATTVEGVPIPEAGTMSGASGIVQCTDYADRPGPARQAAVATAARLAAPITGWFRGLALTMPCEGLTIAPDPVPTFVGNNWELPILMLGATLDTQTPYQWTVSMSTLMRAGRIVTYTGAKHVTFGSGSTCVDSYALDYFINRRLPTVDVACPNAGASATGLL